MEIEQRFMTIAQLVRAQPRINLNPIWQRGPTWRTPRQVLLIDSILRGMDIPKLYLRRAGGEPHAYVAVDGQQRLRAIWAFANDELELEHADGLPPINGRIIQGRSYSTISEGLKSRFNDFRVGVAEITRGSNDEITNLFSRLQMGMPLNPAELRNAILSPLRHVIDAVGTSHEFFVDSKIPEARYKRQDYAAHAFAMAHFQGGRDIKAPDLKAMVRAFGSNDTDAVLALNETVGDALTVLASVNRAANYQITQKWIFVDLAWLIIQRHAAGAVVDAQKLAQAYVALEQRRRRYTRNPEALVRRRSSEADRQLYRYIQAFRSQGAERQNLQTRAEALRYFCPDIDG